MGQGRSRNDRAGQETAKAWKTHDPEAAQASEKITEQVQSRYGLGVNGTEASFSPALTRVQQSRSVVGSERNEAAAARTDAIVTGASRKDREAGG